MLGCEYMKGNTPFYLQLTLPYKNWKDEDNSKQTFSQAAVFVASQNS